MKNMRAAVVTRPLIFYHPKGEFKNDLILSGGGGMEFVLFSMTVESFTIEFLIRFEV